MSEALKALVGKQEARQNWEKAIDQLQWFLLNNRSVPEHLLHNLLRKAEVLRRNPDLAHLKELKGHSFDKPFDKWISDHHWNAIKELAARLAPNE